MVLELTLRELRGSFELIFITTKGTKIYASNRCPEKTGIYSMHSTLNGSDKSARLKARALTLSQTSNSFKIKAPFLTTEYTEEHGRNHLAPFFRALSVYSVVNQTAVDYDHEKVEVAKQS
ncbi:MAG: hypothetical protein SWH68_03475, partial [Thermodesulfobacteriota bacterium]|nr:hypothetical protein [Thermodesulfobacteriota bacterium]